MRTPDAGYAAFMLSGLPFQACSPILRPATSRSYNPARASTRTVWAPPRSLAATCGITVVFSSSGYLDVSVPRVSFTCVMDSHRNDWTLLQPGCPIR